MITISERTAFLLAAVAGAVGWVAITTTSGRREAWDSEAYFGLFLPGIATLVAWLAFLAPRGAWRWAFVPFIAQAIMAFVQNPSGGLMPLGLIVFAILGAVCLVPALVAAWFRRWYDRKSVDA